MGDRFVSSQENGIRTKHKQIIHDNQHVRVMLTVVGVISLVFGVVVAYTVTRSITVPIRKNTDIARTLADGNLSVEITLDRKDEFGHEMEAFKTMIEK